MVVQSVLMALNDTQRKGDLGEPVDNTNANQAVQLG